MPETTIEVLRREGVGKSKSRRLRKADMIPAILYGGGREPISIQIPRKTLLETFKTGGHENRIFLLQLVGTDQSRHAMIRDLQVDPVSSQVVHVDFQRILMDQTVRVRVHLELDGMPYGVKNEAGILDFVTREIEIECLPAAIPQVVRHDVSEIHVGQHVEARDLALPEGVSYVGSPDTVIASVKHARIEVVETPVEEAPAAPESTEPEVIQRGKKEEDEES